MCAINMLIDENDSEIYKLQSHSHQSTKIQTDILHLELIPLEYLTVLSQYI